MYMGETGMQFPLLVPRKGLNISEGRKPKPKLWMLQNQSFDYNQYLFDHHRILGHRGFVVEVDKRGMWPACVF